MNRQHLHILGICGTFMGGVAALAQEQGMLVEGSDVNVYPPMSTQLDTLGITLQHGYDAQTLTGAIDQVIVGNALSRGNPAVEYMLNSGLDYISGPAWLGQNILRHRPVLAVAGTHGKTTTSGMLAYLLQRANCAPGFLIGGVPGNFDVSARLGDASSPFVIEADEYDTAFFDKRSKFVHYHPNIAILNNLEFDHADIFPDIEAIKRQFHHLVRTVPGNGQIIANADDKHIAEVLAMGCWTPVSSFGLNHGDWQARLECTDGSRFTVMHHGQMIGEVTWQLLGKHNVLNALAALAAVHAYGCDVAALLPALADFTNAKRRLEQLISIRDITVYDDFAHHPTAIATTLQGLRKHVGEVARIVVALEPRSNTMKQGVHARTLAPSLALADAVFFLADDALQWDTSVVLDMLGQRGHAVASVDQLLQQLQQAVQPGDHVVFMSNGGFGGASRRFVDWLQGT